MKYAWLVCEWAALVAGEGKVKTVTINVATQRRVVLEASSSTHAPKCHKPFFLLFFKLAPFS